MEGPRRKDASVAYGLTLLLLVAAGPLAAIVAGQTRPESGAQGFKFRTGVELINVAVTVTDVNGRFVPGLRREDFRVYEDDVPQLISHFSNERVPVSLGLALDTSGSMEGDKMVAARSALDRFLFDLLDSQDEVFVYRFDDDPELVQGWTRDRGEISRAIHAIRPRGATAMYDTVAEAIPLAQAGTHRKKALVIISDGNDTSSRTDVAALTQMIKQTEVLVYAIGIDGRGRPTRTMAPRLPPRRPPRIPVPLPFPVPGGRRSPLPPQTPPIGGGPTLSRSSDDRVNEWALRAITDDSGGRTEIIRSARDLDPATASVADELSKQYFLGYEAPGLKDGRWHTIRVELQRGNYHVRARRGYVATP